MHPVGHGARHSIQGRHIRRRNQRLSASSAYDLYVRTPFHVVLGLFMSRYLPRRLQLTAASQWLCNADFTGANPYKRLNTFFSGLYHTLKRGAKAVLQWYVRVSARPRRLQHA